MEQRQNIQKGNRGDDINTMSMAPKLCQMRDEDYAETPASLRKCYRFIKQIGHGSQGKVFLAESLKTQQKVAIKQLNIESVKNWKEYDLFHREAEVLRSLDIYGIAKLYEAIECLDDNPPCSYIVQEYIPGQTLNDMLNAGHRFSLTRVYQIILQLLDILEKLHSHEPPVIHRDIKPSNILLRPVDGDNDMVYLIDFGAVANPQVQSGGSTVAGTYGYMPPEQLTGKPQPASDIYALAAVAVHLISGRSPADMPVKDFHLIFEPDLQNLPTVVVSTLRQMLEPNISKRLTDISQIKKLFNHFLDNTYPVVQNAFANDAEYDIALRNVESLGQPGNIELWQRLPDVVPRKLPEPYYQISLMCEEQYTLCGKFIGVKQLNVGRVFKHKDDDIIVRTGMFDLSADTRIGLKFLIGICIFLIYFMVMLEIGDQIDYPGWIRAFHAFEAILSFGCIFAFLALTVLSGAEGAFSEPKLVKYKLDNPCLKKLLAEGRKTIATVVEVAFIPSSDDATELAFYTCKGSESTGKKENMGCRLIRLDTPMFRIRYKFNPPDDVRSEDLVHEVLVCTVPDGVIKSGDPLPILYRIYRNDSGTKEFVDSMPFPLPLSSLLIKENVLYRDHSGTNIRKTSKRGRKMNRSMASSDLEYLEANYEYVSTTYSDDLNYTQQW